MIRTIGVYLQYLLPKHLISEVVGKLANSKIIWLKNLFIKIFIKIYQVDLSTAVIKNPENYSTFNEFFTRELDLSKREIAYNDDVLLSPVDGCIAQIGKIKRDTLVKAKDFYFDLKALLAGNEGLTELFNGGAFATLYLAPPDYHRVHMPMSGQLTQSIFVPGHLFAVNRLSSRLIPNIYSRNERIINIFDTQHGKIGVILIGALIVGSIQMTWQAAPLRKKIIAEDSHKQAFSQGEELGQFLLGSTVLILSEPGHLTWRSDIAAGKRVEMGENLGIFTHLD